MERTRNLLQEIERWSFIFCIVTLPLTAVSKKLLLPNFARNLPKFFLLVGAIVLIIELLKYRNVEFPYKRFWLFWAGWLVVTQIVGAMQFPHHAEQASQLLAGGGIFFQWLETVIGRDSLLSFSSFIKLAWPMLKNELLYAVGAFFLIYHLYGNRWEKGFLDTCMAVRILAGACCLYSLFEVSWLWTGNTTCEEALKVVNANLYNPQQAHGWWPPLLWKGAARSLFQEPSFFCIVAVFLIPFLLCSAIYRSRKIDALLLVGLSMLVFLSGSRTGVIVLISEVFILLLMSVVFRCPKWKACVKCILGFIGVSFFAMVLGHVYFTSRDITANPAKIFASISSEVSTYIEANISSVIGLEKRSNTARYGNTMARVQVGMEHPLFGTGYEYENWYIRDAFPEWAKDNKEVKGWEKYLLKDGALNSSYPVTNGYAEVFSRSGVLGLLLFLFPPIYVFSRLFCRRKLLSDFRIICLIASGVGQLMCLLSAAWFFTYPISLSLLACVVLADSKKGEN